VHNGNGHSNGKRWVLIGLLILGGFWLVNDSYRDGYTDALIQTGQAGTVRRFHGGPDFPWGLLILGGLGYVAYRKGFFDRFGGPDGPFGPGRGNRGRGIQRYDAQTPGQGFAPGFRGPRAVFDDWHRQAHEADRAQYAAPPAPPAPPAGTPGHGNGHPPGGYSPAPPPPPPAPDYWASMRGAAGNANVPAPPAAPAATEAPPRQDERSAGPHGVTGPTLEQW
jgi:hypothetical protein